MNLKDNLLVSEKIITLSVPIEKEVTRIGKNGEEITQPILGIKIYWQYQIYGKTHYQILSIILLKEFIKLNVYTDIITKNVKRTELNTKIVSAVLNTQALKI